MNNIQTINKSCKISLLFQVNYNKFKQNNYKLIIIINRIIIYKLASFLNIKKAF